MDAETEAALVALAESQLGLFTLRQGAAIGLTKEIRRTKLEHGGIRHVVGDVYRFAGHPLAVEGRHLAAVLATGASSRATHRAGAWLWGMTPHQQKPEITTTDGRYRIKGIRTHFTTTELTRPEVRLSVPVSSAAETLLDLGAVVSLEKVQSALDRGIANRVVTPMSALAELERRGGTGVRGTASLRALLENAGISGSHAPSVLEAKSRRLFKRAGLPQPECELIVGKNGQYRLDFCWPELMLAVEVDGWMYHSSTAAFHNNKTRKNALVVDGYAILEYTWKHVTETPDMFVREVRTAYRARTPSLFGNRVLLSNTRLP